MAAAEFLTISHVNRSQLRRLFSKITIDCTTGCWIWTGARLKKGYGQTCALGFRDLAHRVMFAWLVAPVPKGIGRLIPNLDHVICENPRCCNPAHTDLSLPRRNLLRGGSVSAVNARKSRCPKGHSLSATPNKDGTRVCRTCLRAWHRRHYRSTRVTKIAKQINYEARMSAVPGWRDRRRAMARAAYARRKASRQTQ